MTTFGYTMMCEQSGPKELVCDVRRAEEVGFAFAVISDHYFPWLEAQGHSPYAWSVLGAAAQATSTIELMTYVTCPTMRYHPAIVAQKGATMQLLSDGRFLWRGARNYFELTPESLPAHVMKVRKWVRTERDFDYYF